MAYITKKEMDICKYLAGRSYIKTDVIISYLNISERVLKYSSDNLNNFFKQNNINTRIKIEGGLCSFENYSEDIRSFLNTLDKDRYILSSNERNEALFFHYLAGFSHTINELTDFLSVSKTTIKQSMLHVKEMIKNLGLELQSNTKSGMILKGNEEAIRAAIVHFLYPYSILDASKGIEAANSNPYLKELIVKFFRHNRSLEFAEELFRLSEKNILPVQNDEIYTLSVLNLTTVLYRTSKGFFTGNKSGQLTTEGERLVYSINDICANELKIKLSAEEFYSFAVYLNRGYWAGSKGKTKYELTGSLLIVQQIASQLIKDYSGLDMNEALSDRSTEEALNMVYSHFSAAVERVKKDIHIKNPLTENIKSECSALFEYIRKSVKQLEDYLGKAFSDDDISYFTLLSEYLITRLQETKRCKRNVVIVCGLGQGTSQILKNKLIRKFDINVIDVIPYFKMNNITPQPDIYISTIPITAPPCNTVFVSPFISQTDITVLRNAGLREKTVNYDEVMAIIKRNTVIHDHKNLNTELGTLFNIPSEVNLAPNPLLEHLNENTVLINQKVYGWEEAVRIAGGLLVTGGFADQSYVESMVENVKTMGPHIAIGRGIALPHAENTGNVYKTGFSIVTLSEGVFFDNGKEVNCIICFCAAHDDSYKNSLISVMDLIEQGWLNRDSIKSPSGLIKFIKNKSVNYTGD